MPAKPAPARPKPVLCGGCGCVDYTGATICHRCGKPLRVSTQARLWA